MLKWTRSRSYSDATCIESTTKESVKVPARPASALVCSPSESVSSSSSSLMTKERRRPKKLRVRISDKVSVCELSRSMSSINLLDSVSPCDDEGDRCSDISSGIGSSDDSSSSSELSCCGSDMSTSSADSGIDTEVRANFKRALVRKTPTTVNMRYAKNDKMRRGDTILPRSRRNSGQLSFVDSGLALSMYNSTECVFGAVPSDIEEVTRTTIDITSAINMNGDLSLGGIRDQVLSSRSVMKTHMSGFGKSIGHNSTTSLRA